MPRARQIRVALARGATIAFLGAFPASAAADLDVVVANGDQIRGTLLPATERETFRVFLPAGAELTVKLRSGRNRPDVRVAVLDSGGGELISGTGQRVKLARVRAATTSEHRVVVSSADGETSGDYRVSLRWKSPRRFSVETRLDTAARGTLPVFVESGARVALRDGAVRGGAEPSLLRVTQPNGTVQLLPPRRRGRFAALGTGECTVEFENAGDVAGEVTATASVRARRPRVRRLAATQNEILPGSDVVVAAVLGPAGGEIVAPVPGPLAGARATFPAGALSRATIVALATAREVATDRPTRSTSASASMLVAPYGLVFPATRPTVVLPLGVAAGPAKSALLLYAAQSSVRSVPIDIDAADAAALTFRPVRSSSFQAWHVIPLRTSPAAVVDLDISTRAGLAPAVGGGFAFVGVWDAPGPAGEANAGVVYVFRQTGDEWSIVGELRPPNSAAEDAFGASVVFRAAQDGTESVLVTAPGRAAGAEADDGAVFEYVRDGWTWSLRGEIPNPDSARVDAFGSTIAVEGDLAVIGGASGPYAPYPGAFLMRRTPTGWSFEGEVSLALVGILGGAGALAVAGESLIAGVPDDRSLGGGHQAGSVYVFEPSDTTWTQVNRFNVTPTAQRQLDGFGGVVAARAEMFASTAPRAPLPKVFVGRRTAEGWSIRETLVGDGSGTFGSSLAFGGDALAVGQSMPGLAIVHRMAGDRWIRDFELDPALGVAPAAGQEIWLQRIAFDGRAAVLPISISQDRFATTRTAIAFFDVPE